jgi:Ni,Fe-hydrogenase I cytochrome b subunit
VDYKKGYIFDFIWDTFNLTLRNLVIDTRDWFLGDKQVLVSPELYYTFNWGSKTITCIIDLDVLAITILTVLGLIIFNGNTLGVSVDGKILLKTIHVITGYVFASNLLLRLVMGFFGKGYERFILLIN